MTKEKIAARACCAGSSGRGMKYITRKTIGPRKSLIGKALPYTGSAAEGGLDAAGVLVVADGVPELALGDGRVPVVGPVAVAALEGADGVLGVAQGVGEPAHLVGLAGQEAVAALGPPADLRLRSLSGGEDQVSLPLDP